MPTIPLYQPNAVPDAWHNVRAPGGYEWWYFDAEDTANDRQIVAIFLEGFVFHPGYLRKHFAFAKNQTKRSPVLPSEFPCMYFVVYERGKIRAQFMTQYPGDQFNASRERAEVRIGSNALLPLPVPGERAGVRGATSEVGSTLSSKAHSAPLPNPLPAYRERESAGLSLQLSGTPWQLTGRGPKLLTDQSLSANLTFSAVHPHAPNERVFLSRAMTGAEHQWVIANPLCTVSGSFQLNNETIPFTGKGYHDHNYGTGPLGPGLKRWIWGRVLFDDQAFTFHYAIPKNRSLPAEVHLIEADDQSVREIEVKNPRAIWNKRTALNLAYPSSLNFDDIFQLDSPRVIDNSPFYLRLTYKAKCRGREGTAFCEVAYPHRLRWPVLGRMIEMPIDKKG